MGWTEITDENSSKKESCVNEKIKKYERHKLKEIVTDEPLKFWQAIGMISINVAVVSGVVFLVDIYLTGIPGAITVAITAGYFLFGGVGALFGPFISQNLTGFVMTVYNLGVCNYFFT